MTCKQFKEIFLPKFDSDQTTAATLINLNNSRPKEGACLTSYGSRLMTSVLSRWENVNMKRLFNLTCCYNMYIARFYNRLQRLACTTEITTRKKMQQELKSFYFLKRKHHLTTRKNHLTINVLSRRTQHNLTVIIAAKLATKQSTIVYHNCSTVIIKTKCYRLHLPNL